MVFEIIDYSGHRYKATAELNTIRRVEIRVVTGDEIIDILKKDGSHTTLDPMNRYRRVDYFDYSYVIYDEEKGINVFEEDWFKDRKNSYSVINSYPVTKDYILKYDLSEGTDAYIDYDIVKMLSSNSVG